MAQKYKTIVLGSIASTNTYAAEHCPDTDNAEPVLVVSDTQTAGRGQRGNSWESEPGANLTFSLVLFPRWMSAARQFELSMLVSIGIINTLRGYVDNPEWLKIKWPNDIYFGDRKIAGILIENTVADNHIGRSIIGIGLNVNQMVFHSDAPNPISLIHITGLTIDRHVLLNKLVDNILDMVDSYADDPEIDELVYLYNNLLWRNDSRPHTWRLPDGTEFTATLNRVDADGRLHLTKADNTPVSFLFKEVNAVL